MCGIAGIVAGPGTTIEQTELEGLADALVHRGPDAQGTARAGFVGMASTRLSIVDLTEAGNQPFGDGTCLLAYNGEIYNHEDLRADLERDGTAFDGHSDTEVLFRLLTRDGVEATLPRLKGMFAFSWFDGDRVWLARDRFGIKPLVWTEQRGRVIWSSEAQALGRVGRLHPDVTQALLAFVSLADRSPTRTVFQDVHQVAPGHVVVVDRDARVQHRRWYDLVDDVDRDLLAELADRDLDELADLVDSRLDHAVQRMLMGDASTGTLLSGGVDSALIATLAVRTDGPDHRLFVADVSGRTEAAAASEVASTLGAPLTRTRLTSDDVLLQWASATRHYEAPLVTHMNSVPYAALARSVRDAGVKSALTGEGADELFLGYTEVAFRSFRAVLRAPVLTIQRLYDLFPGLSKRVLPELVDDRSGALIEASANYERVAQRETAIEAYSFLGRRRAERQAEALVMVTGHLQSLLHRNDRMGMAASVESRFPFLDEDLVHLALNIPTHAKLRWGARVHDRKHPLLVDKAVLRCVAGRHVDRAVARRPKDGFPTVGHEQMRMDPGFFADGWLAAQLRWSEASIRRLCETEPRLTAARLASVEVFGRLFGCDQDAATVTDHIRRHTTVAA